MYLVRSREELARILKAYKLAIFQYYDSGNGMSRETRELTYAFRKLSDRMSSRLDVFTGRIDVSKPEFKGSVKHVPMIRVYLDGKVIFEQYGGFGDSEIDYYVLTRSIMNVLEKINAGIKF